MVDAMFAGQGDSAQERFHGQVLVSGGAQAMAGRFQGQGQGPQTCGSQDREQFRGDAVGAHRG